MLSLPRQLAGSAKRHPVRGHYNILVNPFPIFPRHLTVPETAHVAQRIAPRFGDMLDLARQLTDYTIFLQWSQMRRFRPRSRPLPGR